MRIQTLRIQNLRIIEEAELQLEPGLNWLLGANGAGKTSVLEGCSLLASGKSFRNAGNAGLLRQGAERTLVFAELADPACKLTRVGLERDQTGYRGRINGEPVRALSELFAHVPMVFVEPDSASLLTGPGELRRQFVDWGLFHVEQDFLSIWRRYQRALQQRNQVLRSGGSAAELNAWTDSLIASGEPLAKMRAEQCQRLQPALATLLPELLPDLGVASFRLRAGWSAEASLSEALQRATDSDRRLGYTTVGPHRFSWNLHFASGIDRHQLSRGQAKLCALALWLVQLSLFRQRRDQSPLLGLDDVMAELDPRNQLLVVEFLRTLEVQTLLTRAEAPATDSLLLRDGALFHVEQGRVRRQL